MTDTRNSEKADELIMHVRTCPVCSVAKITRTTSRCETRRQLIEETLKERHG